MSDEQFEFLMAIDEYKRTNTRPFPTWTEILEVIKALGYRKVAEPQSLGQSKEDPKPGLERGIYSSCPRESCLTEPASGSEQNLGPAQQ